MLLEVSKEQLLAMSETELVQFAQSELGLVLDPTWPRSKLLYRLMGMSKEVIDY